MEYFVNFTLLTTKEEPFKPIGFEVAKEQHYLEFLPNVNTRPIKRPDDVIYTYSENKLTVDAGMFRSVFDTISGQLISLQLNGKEMLEEPVSPDFWRAPTDNDFGNRMEQRQAIWRNTGKYAQLETFSIKANENGKLLVLTNFKLEDARSYLNITYEFSGDGEIEVVMNFKPGITGLQNFPRFGLGFVLKDADNLEYYGRGPHENYCDRNTSAFIGKHKVSVADQYFAYIRPQENGYKTDTRWLILSNGNKGLFFTSGTTFSFSALHTPTHMLDQLTRSNYKHTVDIKQLPHTYLHIDMKQMGVGGDNSWGARPHKPYQIPVQEYEFRFSISPWQTGYNGFEMWMRE